MESQERPEVTMSGKPLLSVVVPVYSEATVIPEFYRRLTEVLARLSSRFEAEILYIDDGSRDASLSLLEALAAADGRVRVISFSRNFGHQFAITAGLDHARGDAVVVIDGDLQDPPEVIPEMVRKWEDGFKVVFGVREKRKGESVFKRLTAKAFYRLLRFLSDTAIPVDAGDFRLLDRQVVLALRAIREENRYMRGLVSWAGFSQTGFPYRRDPRYAGRTKFTLKKMVRFAFDGILSFSDKPLKLTAYAGFLFTAVAFVLGLRVIINKIRFPEALVSGWASLLIAVLFIGGVQLISIGILGLYLGRQYREVKRRPLYVVAKTVNLGEQTAGRDGE
jgi:dolichol-phosphate mannosyltransferase